MIIRKRIGETVSNDMELLTLVADALAHPVRLELLKFIMQKNKAMELVCTSDLVENFDYAQATISQHMNKLSVAGLVNTRSAERRTYYFADASVITEYMNAIKRFATMQ